MREKIEKFITAWERKANADMFLSERLHPRIKTTLIEGLLSIIEDEDRKPLTAAMVKEAVAAAKPHEIKPKADGTFEVHPAKSDDDKAMAALKAKLAKSSKGKAA